MKEWQGLGIFPKTVIGPIYVVPRGPYAVPTGKIKDIPAEIKRFENARQKAKNQLKDLYQQVLTQTDQENAAIFDIHQMMLDDEDYIENIRRLIKNELYNAAFAVEKTGEHFAEIFANMEDEYMKARAADVKDISQRLSRILCGAKEQYTLDKPSIIAAQDLVPSQILMFDEKYILGFATAKGSVNSHAAILARAKGLPAVVGLGKQWLDNCSNNQTAILNGENGTFITEPNEETLQQARQKLTKQQEDFLQLNSLKGTPDETKDGFSIRLYANVGSLAELKEALLADARGVGLFRTEFLYLDRKDYPTEEILFDTFKQAAQMAKDKLIIFRTLDIGADKTAPYFNLPSEENPALGMRAIRLCLTRPKLFKTQLRALLRASAFGNIAIMYPMISCLKELEQAQSILEETKQELLKEKIAFNKDIQTGIMIETPAAALVSEKLAPLVDFFSIGTNDLLQYTCALDRQNSSLIPFTDLHHPALFKLIKLTINNAHSAGKWVGICGEIAADTSLTETFLRMGIDELSVAVPHILRVRRAIQQARINK